MTAIPLKSIEGCLLPRRSGGYEDYDRIYNAAITKQGKVQIALNREKLAKAMWENNFREINNYTPSLNFWDKMSVKQKKLWRTRADAILNALPELIEVVND